jgi:hypothetical protein
MRLKRKSKITWEGWKSRGNEPQVFSVEHPCELRHPCHLENGRVKKITVK